jgi:hypothetical protein
MLEFFMFKIYARHLMQSAEPSEADLHLQRTQMQLSRQNCTTFALSTLMSFARLHSRPIPVEFQTSHRKARGGRAAEEHRSVPPRVSEGGFDQLLAASGTEPHLLGEDEPFPAFVIDQLTDGHAFAGPLGFIGTQDFDQSREVV